MWAQKSRIWRGWIPQCPKKGQNAI